MRISILRRSPLLRALSARMLQRVLKVAELRDVPAGAHIFSKADLAGHMFIVASGSVKIYSSSGAKKRKTFAHLGPGDFFGEIALLDGKERSASAVAVDDCRLVTIAKRDFKDLLLRDPGMALSMLRCVTDRLRRANEEIESLLFRNVLGRVSKTLVELGRKNGRPSRGGILIPSRYTHQELADMVGTTREPLSRAIAVLRRGELVEVRRGRFFLADPKKMDSLVGAGAG